MFFMRIEEEEEIVSNTTNGKVKRREGEENG